MPDDVKPLGLLLDPDFEGHETGPGHPERPERLVAIRQALERSGLAGRCERQPTESADDEMLCRVHAPEHVRRVEDACRRGVRLIDSMDTAIGPRSAEIARRAAGSVAALSLRVARGELRAGFAAPRPPGHHAERDQAMGFCLFNSVAVAARHVIATAGLERILVVDWDVHHGNGTQHLFDAESDVFYFSVHQSPLYPGTGSREETGTGAGRGFTRNVPLAPGSGDAEFLAALRVDLAEAAERYRPQLVLVSAGFDAHRADPLAQLEVSTEAYAEATRIVREIAGRHAGGKLVSVLEGGYDLGALADSVEAHVAALLDS